MAVKVRPHQDSGGRKPSFTADVSIRVEISGERDNLSRLQRLQIVDKVRKSLAKSLRPRGRVRGRQRKGKECERRRRMVRMARRNALCMALQRVWRRRREERRWARDGPRVRRRLMQQEQGGGGVVA